MKILFIYRNPQMGFSIGKVFKPIEIEMSKCCEVDSIELPCSNYAIKSLITNIKYVKKQVKRTHYDIIHITGTEHYLLPFLQKKKTVMTVHDLGFYTNNKKGIRSWFKYLLWIKTLPLAGHITFISNKSKAEAEIFVRFKKDNVSVIYDPISNEYTYHPKIINTKYPTILHLGTNPHKNLIRTIEALKEFPCKLCIVGKLHEDQMHMLQKHKIDYENVYNLTEQEVLEKYINCDIVSFVSLHEGFGMPIIEGQSIGRPILTSNITPMKEIASNGGAILVSPWDVKSIRNGYQEALTHSDDLIKKGLENVKRFRLDIITSQYQNVYKQLMKA